MPGLKLLAATGYSVVTGSVREQAGLDSMRSMLQSCRICSKRKTNAEAAGALSSGVLLFPHSQLDRMEFRFHFRHMGSPFLPTSI